MTYATDYESWLSIGYENALFYEHAIATDSYMMSNGITLKGYTFWNNKNIGLFVHDSFLFPYLARTTINGEQESVLMSDYDLKMQVGLIIGPVFKLPISAELQLISGIGPSFMMTGLAYSEYIPSVGEIGYASLGNGSLRSDSSYRLISIRPNICIGFVF